MVVRLKQIAVYVVLSVAALSAAYEFGNYQQRQQLAVDAAQAAAKAIHNRVGINETIGNMDSVHLCLELGGLHSDCVQLRGLAAD